MRIAYIILAHKNPTQLTRLILRLNNASHEAFFFIHIDGNTKPEVYNQFIEKLKHFSNIYFLKRYKTHWGDFNIVNATLEGIQQIFKLHLNFDYSVLLSGQDYPIKPVNEFKKFLKDNQGKEFIDFFSLYSKNKWVKELGHYPALKRINVWHFRFRGNHFHIPLKRKFPYGFEPYGGSQWWCLSKECLNYINQFVQSNSQFVNYFKYTYVPDEIFFQTIILNSQFKDRTINNNYRYIDWSKHNPTPPGILEEDDFDKLFKASHFFARKFDIVINSKILNLIDEKILDFQCY
ncbi:hypothetical protein WA1_16010 [Scytonema hofmannii PCC 7110]|uniref:Peptide O-xylosyltransferase n=1 Tax=Scytonema hofmannii PCC 7110 TaxID=128403 RepID=A0A139XA46_9CYAN|nr:beta-1,6-N-acetylglucosaminyltransferase [Scytonema hofmannii]KYC41555.1 hypothetical protein WA1_16010 [Scytonema hofmannii PCC 7110]